MPNSRKNPSSSAAQRRAQDPGRPTGRGFGLVPADAGYGGGNEWLRDVRKGSAELARRVRTLLGARGHG